MACARDITPSLAKLAVTASAIDDSTGSRVQLRWQRRPARLIGVMCKRLAARPCASSECCSCSTLLGVLHSLRSSARHPWLAASASARGCARVAWHGFGNTAAARREAKARFPTSLFSCSLLSLHASTVLGLSRPSPLRGCCAALTALRSMLLGIRQQRSAGSQAKRRHSHAH